MNFARKQLEKYGWSEGKGLGKHENGISQPLKAKIKRSVTGIGHDPASEFNEHWWSALYDKAGGNVEVQENNGKTKKIETKGDLTITTNTWQISKRSKQEAKQQYSEFFVRTAVLTNGGNNVEKVRESDSEDSEVEKKDVLKMTDEELFAACKGRTAHKGARHGLKATGKLARIAHQEAMLLSQSKYNGYSHANKSKEPIEDAKLSPDVITDRKKKKKTRKRCFSREHVVQNCETDCLSPLAKEIRNDTSTITIGDNGRKKKSKKSKTDKIDEDNDDLVKPKKKLKRKVQGEESSTMETYGVETEDENVSKKKKKIKDHKKCK